MSAPFALDPALSSNSTDATPPTTADPSSLTKAPAKETVRPNHDHNPNPAYYSILPALPPLPGWGPFPGPMFAPPGPMPAPVPMYMVPGPWHHDMSQPPPSMAVGLSSQPQPPSPTPAPVTATTTAPRLHPAQTQTPSQPRQTQAQPKSHYPPERIKPNSAFPQPNDLLEQTGVKHRPKRNDPPPINPAATVSPHYQNPGGFGGVYTPPSHAPADLSPPPSHSHYSHKSLDTPSSSSGDLGRPFSCGMAGCSAAFDRKSDCERHRRTHAKGAADTRPFKCSRPGCEAAFDRKDALMRHERNERTHLVRQTQPGRIKRPTRAPSKFDAAPRSPPRRMSTRKRKSVAPGIYVDPSESDFEDDEGEYVEGNIKRIRAGESEDEHHNGGMHDGLGGQSTMPLSTLETHPTCNNPNPGSSIDDGGMEDMVVIPPDEQLVIDPRLRADANFDSSLRTDGFVVDAQGDFTGTDEDFAHVGVGVETLQAVEAIQAALQQMEADKGHEPAVV
ncbi:zinc C2H2 finger protein [Rhizoctonia solani AG-3 Rhs1AP]|uniref:Zinc C2H2 finger protein n=1 Tax=Rhizoctonia solani AG-3 Rhs1AP TaxID=1086054 RepID=X8J0S0_9AGAM|nr:zinc C2H2 finger protein [Rhizoctonia solani AG-3 Rhs1AP]